MPKINGSNHQPDSRFDSLVLSVLWILASTASIFLANNKLLAGLAPESVLLVVNGDRPASLTVANEYANLRSIPAINIVTLSHVTNVEQLSVEEFRTQILGPVLKAIDERGLRSQIHCVAYSVELPTAIRVDGDVGDRKLPQILTPVGSINGLTFLHRMTMAKDIRYLDLNSNFYARRIGTLSNDRPWLPEEQKRYAEALQRLQIPAQQGPGGSGERPADALSPVNDPVRLAAIDVMLDLKRAHPKSAELLYNLACCQALIDRPEEAFATLKEAVEAGWLDHRHTARDSDLKSMRDLHAFKSLLETMKAVRLEVLPSRGFRGDVGWLPNGEPTMRDEASRYLLSTMLGVTTGRGMTVAEVIDNLKRSATADGARPKGTVYFVRNGDVRSTTREWGFASAVDKLKSLGVDAAIEEGVLPHRKNGVAGAMIGIADFDWRKSESTILPGAIVEHLTSFGGVMTAGAGQTPLTEFLHHGAGGSSGTVTEPFALQAKFPNPFIHVHYASGSSLAEAFYQSVTGPYQLLIVGDPLCNPWRRDFSVTVQTPAKDKPWSGVVTLNPSTTSVADLKAAEHILFVDGKRIVASSENGIRLDTTMFDDGEHQITVLARANDDVETMGRWVADIEFRNGNSATPVSMTSTAVATDAGIPISLQVSRPGATEIVVLHFGRIVATIKGEMGSAILDPHVVGSGPVSLQPIATLANGQRYRGRPVIVTRE